MSNVKNAMSSLYGEGHVEAEKLNKTRARECVAMPGTRNQTILSPESIAQGLRELWSDGVAYDPCYPDHGSEGYIIDAEKRTSTRGLMDRWIHKTYANPPYGKSLFDVDSQIDDLRLEEKLRAEAKAAGKKSVKWPKGSGLPLKKAGLKDWLDMQLKGEGESVLLCPNRTNRKWLREWRASVDALVELNPLSFLGHEQAFPAPLVLGFVLNPVRDEPVDKDWKEYRIESFFSAFSHLGDPVIYG